MENQANVRKWIQGLASYASPISIYWINLGGLTEYKTLNSVELQQISKYVTELEAAIVSLVFKQIQSESKP